MCENPEQVDPTPFAAKAVDEIGKRWRSLGPSAVSDGRPQATEHHATKSGLTKNGLKTILNILKGICKDVHDFEQGLAEILDRDPQLMAASPLSSVWLLRAQSIKACIR